MTKRVLTCLFLALTAFLCSCSGIAPTRSGFLGDYETLAPEDGDEAILSCQHQPSPWPPVAGIVIEPVTVMPGSEQLSDEDARGLASYFEAELHSALSEVVPVALPTDPDVLRLRSVVTDTEGVSLTVNFASVLLLGLPFDNGGVSVELQIVDANDRLLYRASMAATGSVFLPWNGLRTHSFARCGLDDVAAHVAKTVRNGLASPVVEGVR